VTAELSDSKVECWGRANLAIDAAGATSKSYHYVLDDSGDRLRRVSRKDGSTREFAFETDWRLDTVAAPTDDIVYIGGTRPLSAPMPTGSVLLSTRNGGETWQRRPVAGHIRELHFQNGMRGHLIGSDYRWTTDDGGDTLHEETLYDTHRVRGTFDRF